MAPQTTTTPNKTAPESYGLVAMQSLIGTDPLGLAAELLAQRVNTGYLGAPQRELFETMTLAAMRKLAEDAATSDLSEDESTPRGYGAWLRATMKARLKAFELDAAQKALRG